MEKWIGATTAAVPQISDELAVINHGTELDQDDMARMGKDPVLKFWLSPLHSETFAQFLLAYLRSLFHIRIFHGPDDLMGGSNSVSCFDPIKSATEKCF